MRRPTVTLLALCALAACKIETQPAAPAAPDPSSRSTPKVPPPKPTEIEKPVIPPMPESPFSDRTLFFYYGPLAPMNAEVILNSISEITGHEYGAYDFTAPDRSTRMFREAGNNSPYQRHCTLLGGCLEHRVPLGRRPAFGAVYVIQLEKAAAEGCYDREAFGMFPGSRAPDRTTGPDDVIRHQYLLAFGAEPTTEDLVASRKYFDIHVRDPDFDDVPPLESAGRGHCRALLASNRFLFY